VTADGVVFAVRRSNAAVPTLPIVKSFIGQAEQDEKRSCDLINFLITNVD
jgi:hypothetical protein